MVSLYKSITSLIIIIALANGDCVSDPSSSSCINYEYPVANATADIDSLCVAMFYMPVCSVQSACKAASSSTGICEPWSMLADSCKYDMPMMQGCATFNKICATGSVVNSCTNYSSIVDLPTTVVLNQQVFSICNNMSMQPCTQCPISNTTLPAFLKCDLLEVYSNLCMQMPDMSQCSAWSTLCDSKKTLYDSDISGDFCSKPISEQVPLMRMFFHTGILDYILFESWVPRTTRQFAGFWFACFFFAVVFECEKSLRSILEKRWESQTNSSSENNTDDSEDGIIKSTLLKGSYPKFSYRDIIRGFLHGLELTMSYVIMLVAMTFNVGLFFSVIAGTIIGNIAVGRFRAYKPKLTCCD